MSEFKIRSYLPSWGFSYYITRAWDEYLWKDGLIHKDVYSNKNNAFNEGCWEAEREAQEFLNQWENRAMNNDLQAKLEQAKKDRDTIDNNIKEIEKQIEDSNPVYYRGDKFIRRGVEWILCYSGHKAALISLEEGITMAGFYDLDNLEKDLSRPWGLYGIRKLPTSFPEEFTRISSYFGGK